MDTLVEQISKIEIAAVKIMDESDLQIKFMDEEAQKKIESYDLSVDQNTEQNLAKVRQKLESQRDQELSQLKKDAMEAVLELENRYSKNHETLANQILQKIIEG